MATPIRRIGSRLDTTRSPKSWERCRSSGLAFVLAVGLALFTFAAWPARASGGTAALGAVHERLASAGSSPTVGSVLQESTPSVPRVDFEVVGSYPHDRGAFLQGLVWYDGGFYESTGLYGRSTLRRVAFPSGDVVQQIALPSEYFGEGLALVGDRLIQLTWRSRRGFVYDRASFGLIGEFGYRTEGWGLTFDGTSLIMSDGSDVLTLFDPETFQPRSTIEVTIDGRPLRMLNELEWIEGEIWANVWQTDQIVRIDPSSGRVTGYLDLTGILPPEARDGHEDVLNGIAYDAATGRIFVGGKLWPLLFEIRPV